MSKVLRRGERIFKISVEVLVRSLAKLKGNAKWGQQNITLAIWGKETEGEVYKRRFRENIYYSLKRVRIAQELMPTY